MGARTTEEQPVPDNSVDLLIHSSSPAVASSQRGSPDGLSRLHGAPRWTPGRGAQRPGPRQLGTGKGAETRGQGAGRKGKSGVRPRAAGGPFAKPPPAPQCGPGSPTEPVAGGQGHSEGTGTISSRKDIARSSVTRRMKTEARFLGGNGWDVFL